MTNCNFINIEHCTAETTFISTKQLGQTISIFSNMEKNRKGHICPFVFYNTKREICELSAEIRKIHFVRCKTVEIDIPCS